MNTFLVLLVVAGLAHAAPPEDIAAGKALYDAKCVKCHKPRDPNKYSVAAWDKAMVKMKKKAKLTDEQGKQIDAYVESIRTPKP